MKIEGKYRKEDRIKSYKDSGRKLTEREREINRERGI